jgi:hypothetical protein
MKELILKWWFWLVIVLILALIIFTVILLNSSNDGVGSAGISKEEFNEIIVGQTTNFELNSIIDKNDEWNEDEVYDKCVKEIENFKKDNKYTYVYKYYGEKGGYAIITLQADYSNGYYYNDVVVIKKENFNLK